MVKGGRKSKHAQVGIITTVLIILIVIILAAIVWNIVVPLIREKGDEVQLGQITVSLEIQGAVLFENGVSAIKVHRNSGTEEVDGLKFVFYDESGSSKTRNGETINGLETKTYSFAAIPEIGKITRVGVAPIINGNLGMVIESKPETILKVPSGVISWWKFDDLNDFISGNNCFPMGGQGVSNGILDGEVNCSANGLDFKENMAISFWVKGNSVKSIIKKEGSYEISINETKKLKFNAFSSGEGTSDEKLNESWNHIVISVAPAFSKIYVNTVPKTFNLTSFDAGDSNLIFNGEIDDVMIFDRSITNIEGLYNIQKKD